MLYKSLDGLALDYLSSKCVDRSYVSDYSLRDTKGKPAIPLPHTIYMKNSFSYSGELLWNDLPIRDLRSAGSLGAFRTGCERFLSSIVTFNFFCTRQSCKAGFIGILIV